jgi:hypothetical protein
MTKIPVSFETSEILVNFETIRYGTLLLEKRQSRFAEGNWYYFSDSYKNPELYNNEISIKFHCDVEKKFCFRAVLSEKGKIICVDYLYSEENIIKWFIEAITNFLLDKSK